MAKASNAKEAESQPAASEGTTRPIVKFDGSGGLHVAVWKHPTENGAAHYSIRIDRSFKNNDGGIESSAYLREGDLLRVQKLLGQVDDWIEQDKAKFRSNGVRQASAGKS